MRIIDRRHEAMGGQPYNRPVSQLTQIALHWSGALSNIWNHENWWKNGRGWKMGGYHFWIDRQGNIYQNYNYTVQTNGVSGENFRTVHVCVESNSLANYTSAQEQARDWLIKKIMDDLNIKADNVRGHNEWPNQTTVCPGYSKSYMDALREALANGQSVALPPVKVPVVQPSSTPRPAPRPQVTQLAIDGSFGPATTRRLQQVLGTQVTGAIGGQQRTAITENIASVQFGSGGSMVVREMQRRLGLPQNQQGGLFGPLTLRALQRRMGTPVTGAISRTNSAVVKELQRRLNQNRF